jgi:hypothetical protein
MRILILSLCMCIIAGCSGKSELTVRDLMTVKDINTYINKNDKKVKRSFNTMNPVKFSHSLHEGLTVPAGFKTVDNVFMSRKNGNDRSMTCNTCHHKKNNPSRIKTCSWCHKGVSPGAKIIHDFCNSCHTKKKGPLKCIECHRNEKKKQTHDDLHLMFKNTYSFTKKQHNYHKKLTENCSKCHHREKTASKKCSSCHSDRSRIKIMHIFCRNCHREMTSGPVTCTACHRLTPENKKKMIKTVVLQKTGHRKPSILFNHKSHMEDYNTECVDCHHKGSLKRCSSCHKIKDVKNVINIKGAFHQQCHNCHRNTRGPKACKLCHRKKIK